MSGISSGQAVHVWSDQFQQWFEDGVVLEARTNGSVKVQYPLKGVPGKSFTKGRWRNSMKVEEIAAELIARKLRVEVSSKFRGGALLLQPRPSNRFALGELVAVWSADLGAWQLDGRVQHISDDGSVTVQYSNGTAEKQVPAHEVHYHIQKTNAFPHMMLGRFHVGQQVSVWSASLGGWVEDGTVEEELSGFIRVRYNDGCSTKEALNMFPNDAIKANQLDETPMIATPSFAPVAGACRQCQGQSLAVS